MSSRIIVSAEIIHVGRKIGTARAQITDVDGRLYSTATTTCVILGT